ncbi:MAG: nucleotide exchange factor GrpE [Clostridia bacterium]|nr:nucleotide exchange factor GrpE [Clostridia bacterium]
MAKKNSNLPPEEPVIAEEEVKAPETEVTDVENIDIVAIAQAKVEEYKGLLQRERAEFDNFRKRNAEAVKVARADGGSEVVISMLPILDTVQIAINMISDEASKSGVQLIEKKFMDVFSKYGVKEIEALGKDFDPNLHNAVMQVEDADNAGKVVEVLQKGYTRDGKVIRYSMVKVAN